MASIFNALHIGYSGLNASQIGINTTSHNIANAETEGYTRQRVVTAPAYPISIYPGDRGNGVEVDSIVRIFDSFVYDRYTKAAQDKSYSDFMRDTLETLSTYFPEVEDVGIKTDLHTYFDMWQTLADNPDNSAVKVALAQQAQILSEHIQQTRGQVRSLQDELNTQLAASIDEVNRLASEIAELNRAIENSEVAHLNNANDLRDQRNQLELALAKLVGADVFSGEITTDMTVDKNVAERQEHYNIHIAGFNIVDGVTFHPIGYSNTDNPEGFYDLFYERQDGEKVPFTYQISDGKVGAILDLRGSELDDSSGVPTDGTLQSVIDQLDAFAASLIENTNNVYARSATTRMESHITGVDGATHLVNSGLNIRTGSFDIVLYDIDGNETARRSITIDDLTAMDDGTAESIVGQIGAIIDDNGDNNANNDISSLLKAQYLADGTLILEVTDPSAGYTFAIEDDASDGGTNFAGAMGLHRFFDGSDGKDIALHHPLKNDPSLISAFRQPQAGNNETALNMVQLQFDKVSLQVGQTEMTETLYNFFDSTATYVGSATNAAITQNDSRTAQFNTVETEYFSISRVSVDEELTNLIKYQTAYGAAAKVITTIDQMMDTLLGIKR
jgi:flagellar hook-associated protein 1 FlgK